jgi:hypothetical protein
MFYYKFPSKLLRPHHKTILQLIQVVVADYSKNKQTA